jgi:predicted hotdog family 3-hydroxylacyl-ACP dehydratase
MRLDREEIAALIPHAGAMCLLDRVIDWDSGSVRCVSGRHRLPDNPLARAGALGGLCGIEFAAQAMALHGRLAGTGDARPRMGYLVSLRDVTCRMARLDRIAGDLVITAERLAGEESEALYRFAIESAGARLLEGRATVLLAVPPP